MVAPFNRSGVFFPLLFCEPAPCGRWRLPFFYGNHVPFYDAVSSVDTYEACVIPLSDGHLQAGILAKIYYITGVHEKSICKIGRSVFRPCFFQLFFDFCGRNISNHYILRFSFSFHLENQTNASSFHDSLICPLNALFSVYHENIVFSLKLKFLTLNNIEKGV